MCDLDKQYNAYVLFAGKEFTRFCGQYSVPVATAYNQYQKDTLSADRITDLQNRGEKVRYEWNETTFTFDLKEV
jgi:hypothetical protein